MYSFPIFNKFWISEKTKEAMREILDNIQSGNFANEFLDDCRQSNDGSGGPFMKSNRKSTKNHPIEEVGRELRSKMKFLNSEKLVDIVIHDVGGRVVFSKKYKLNSGKNIVQWNALGQPSGLYLISAIGNNYSMTRKAIFVK